MFLLCFLHIQSSFYSLIYNIYLKLLETMFHLNCLILLVSLAIFTINDPIDPEYNYQIFYVQFDRNYVGQEKAQHAQIFDRNYADLLRRREEGQDVQVNDFLDWNQTQYRDFFNYNPLQLELQLSEYPTSSSLYLSPPLLDWRALGRVTDVKDQSSCGSCWSFSSTGVFESMLAIATNGTKYDLAQQYGVECQRVDSNGCNGGYPLTALRLFNRTGIPLQSKYPYKPASPRYYSNLGQSICNDSTNSVKLNKPIPKATNYANLTTQQIQQSLSKYGPLSIAVYAGHTGFSNVGRSGRIVCPTTTTKYNIDHAVILVGYNSTHWIIKNSWGTTWGDNGFGYISKSADCGLRFWVDVLQVDYGYVPDTNNNTSNNTSNNTNNSTSNNTSNNTDNSTNNVTTFINLTITMTDSKGDGWNGNVLAIRQNNTVVGLFGSLFTSGSSSGPINIRVNARFETHIVVFRKGSMTDQIGFEIKLPNGTIVYTRTPGQTYARDTIFKIFCPISVGCSVASIVQYYLTLYDSWGDGWNGNVLAFRQPGQQTKTFGQEMAFVRQLGPIRFNLTRFIKTDVVVYKIGSWSQQVGFEVRTYDGRLVASRNPGVKFYANNILLSFCPDCVNLVPVFETEPQIEQQEHNEEPEIKSNLKTYIIVTYTLVGVSVVLGLLLLVTCIKFSKLRQANKNIVPQNSSNIDFSNEIKSTDQTSVGGLKYGSNVTNSANVDQSIYKIVETRQQ